MIDLGIGIALGGLAFQAFNVMAGFARDRQVDKILRSLNSIEHSIEELGRNIIYVSGIDRAMPIDLKGQSAISDKSIIHAAFKPIQKKIGSKILVAKPINTPSSFQNSFKQNPWDVLIDIRPSHRVHDHVKPHLLPLTFRENNEVFVGWVQKGVLPSLLNGRQNSDSGFFDRPEIKSEFPVHTPEIDYGQLARELIDTPLLAWKEDKDYGRTPSVKRESIIFAIEIICSVSNEKAEGILDKLFRLGLFGYGFDALPDVFLLKGRGFINKNLVGITRSFYDRLILECGSES